MADRRLQVFHAVAKHGSFTRAAEHLHMTQPAVTFQIKQLEEHFNTIIDSVKVILERTPPELGADIFKHGVYLTGGASQTSHFAELLQKSTGLKVNQAQRPLESVVLGMGRILKEDNYKSVAYAIEGMGK